jgi:hypothetical protein
MCVLFSLYLNDLEDFFQINDINGLKSISDEVETELNYYLKLFVLVERLRNLICKLMTCFYCFILPPTF